jgi:lipoteichoic acid synthase
MQQANPSASTKLRQFFSAGNVIRKNLLKRYRKWQWHIPHMFLFPVVFVYFEVLLRLFSGDGLFSHLIYPILFGLSAGLLCTCLTSPFPRKVNRGIGIALLLLTGLLFTVECLIRDSYQVYMTLGAIRTGAGGVVGGFSEQLFSAILHGLPVIFLFFLPALLYIFLGRRRVPAWRCRPAFVALLLVLALVVFGAASVTASHGTSGEKYKSQFSFNTGTQWFGLLASVRLQLQQDLFGNSQQSFTIEEPEPSPSQEPVASEEEETAVVYGDNVVDLPLGELIATSDDAIASIHTYVNSLTPSSKNAYTGLFAGKNLILICAEAFSDVVIDEELTPTLYRLTHNGFYFSDYYQPSWGGSTSTGEYSFLTGLAPLDGVETMLETQNNNMYYTLGNQLMRLGYFSRAYHNGEYDYYSRQLTHENLGYEQFLALGNGLEDIAGWWTDDETMFDTTMDTYLDQQPFSIYYMTISGHCTYTSDKESVSEHLSQVKERYGDRYQDTTMYYLCYQLELEDALTTMVQKLEDAGIADDTVICLTADHYPYGLENTATFGNDQDYVSDLYGYTYETSWEQDHSTLIIWSGCLENEDKDMACEISTPTYSLDIVPTLSNLFGLEFDSRLLVGRDVFSDAEPLVLWNNYSWVTTEGKYDSSTGTFYPNDGVTVDDSYITRISNIVANKLAFSGKVLDYDYYGILFDDDN